MKTDVEKIINYELQSSFLRYLAKRGCIYQTTNLAGLDTLAAKGLLTAYIGFDATGDSLHIGHLLPIMMLRRLQKTVRLC
jgi:tyrosyl-tRNA synthetase